MAVTFFGPNSTTGTIDEDGHVTLTVNMQCRTDNELDNAWTVLIHSYGNLPIFFDGTYFGTSSNANAFISGIGPAQLAEDEIATRRKWLIPVTYTTKPTRGSRSSGGGANSNPLSPFTTPTAEPWRISGTYVRGEKTTNVDRNGDLILTLGTREPRSFVVPDGHDTLRLEGATASIALATRAQAVFRCNSATIWGLTPRQLLMLNWAYDIRSHGNTSYVYNVLDFEINYDGWTERFRNLSLKMVNPAWVVADGIDARLMPYVDAAGVEVRVPSPIDDSGTPCDPEDASEIAAEVIHEYDFTTLGLPSTLPGPFV